MVNLDDPSTPQLKVAKKWLDAYSSRDASKLDLLLSKRFKHETFPKSLLPEETKEEHIERYRKMIVPMTTYELVTNEVIEAPGKVVLHSRVTCSAHGTTFSADCARILSLIEEDGELKILQIKQFSDPGQHSAFYAAGKGAPAS